MIARRGCSSDCHTICCLTLLVYFIHMYQIMSRVLHPHYMGRHNEMQSNDAMCRDATCREATRVTPQARRRVDTLIMQFPPARTRPFYPSALQALLAI